MFLTALVIASKYVNDVQRYNRHWAALADRTFDLHDIITMENQLLQLLDYNFQIKEEELMARLAPLFPPTTAGEPNTTTLPFRLRRRALNL